MMQRQLVSSETMWESVVGYSRAVRVGSWVSVAGTTAAADGGGAVGGDPGRDGEGGDRFRTAAVRGARGARGAGGA